MIFYDKWQPCYLNISPSGRNLKKIETAKKFFSILVDLTWNDSNAYTSNLYSMPTLPVVCLPVLCHTIHATPTLPYYAILYLLCHTMPTIPYSAYYAILCLLFHTMPTICLFHIMLAMPYYAILCLCYA